MIANPELDSHPLDTTILKRIIDEKSTNNFKTLLSEVNWDDVYKLNSPNTTYDLFIQTFTDLYDKCFPKVKIKLKTKSLLSPWITKGLKKSSKRKQKLYDKFLKNKSYKNELKYKSYKNLFETIKYKSKKNYYAKLLTKYKNNVKKTWQIMQEITGKLKLKNDNLPRRIVIDKIETYDKKLISETFNEFFTSVGPKLAEYIPNVAGNFKSYLQENNFIMNEKCLEEKELQDAFFSVKINKSSGHDDVNFNIVKQVFQYIKEPLQHVFNLSLPDDLKIAKITPIFKSGEQTCVSNYSRAFPKFWEGLCIIDYISSLN